VPDAASLAPPRAPRPPPPRHAPCNHPAPGNQGTDRLLDRAPIPPDTQHQRANAGIRSISAKSRLRFRSPRRHNAGEHFRLRPSTGNSRTQPYTATRKRSRDTSRSGANGCSGRRRTSVDCAPCATPGWPRGCRALLESSSQGRRR
jgi:hypothetical protein